MRLDTFVGAAIGRPHISKKAAAVGRAASDRPYIHSFYFAFFSFSAWSAVAKALMISSKSPSMTESIR